MFAERVKQLRESFGDTQEKFATRLGTTQRMVSYWERGVNEASNDMLIKVADLCGVTIDYLLGRTDTPNLYAHPIGQIDGVGARGISTHKDPPTPEQTAALIKASQSDKAVTYNIADLPKTREELAEFIRIVMRGNQ
ncbi:hypothetical protein AGMMS49992_33450 [Clostridia bacterium]|nr:hypothetical protein AGMMS49992_33450 [Clostridia bacterium]